MAVRLRRRRILLAQFKMALYHFVGQGYIEAIEAARRFTVIRASYDAEEAAAAQAMRSLVEGEPSKQREEVQA